ncbi:MAG: peptidoglycan-binding protein [candidate division Zixibacteria bacterium]|nr:peptidoglycan-binding protein [candidate division Zixibacteria bacterium]
MATIHKVKQGECLSSIAQKYGFPDWKKIYNHPENKDFKEKRPNPNVLYPGDKIFIPDKEEKEESCGTESKHTFKVKRLKTWLRLALKDEKGDVFAGKKYKLAVGGQLYEGTTDSDGLIEHQIPADEEAGKLTVWLNEDGSGEGVTWNLKIGHLDPIEEVSGVQARLNNLGFNCGAVDGIFGPKTKEALKAFQSSVGLEISGQIDQATRDQLCQLHDGV